MEFRQESGVGDMSIPNIVTCLSPRGQTGANCAPGSKALMAEIPSDDVCDHLARPRVVSISRDEVAEGQSGS